MISSPASPDVAVLIATYNRATLLGDTLDVLARSHVPPGLTWEVVVVDNNSRDNTREVVESRQAGYPVPLRYLFESRQGRSAALNAAHAATAAPLLLYTDDDVHVAPGWMASGAQALMEGWDYIGGPVSPMWEAPRPAWLHPSLHGTIAILDYGRDRFVFEERRRVPLGANMGARRDLLNRIGGFREDLGRSNGRKIMGQEVPELLARARAAGARGLYVPEMHVDHHIPAARLTKDYFRRWWYGKGASKSMLELAQPLTELGIDLRSTPHVGRVPRYLVSDALRDAARWFRATVAGDEAERFRREMMLAYAAGYAATRGLGLNRPPYRDPASDAAGARAIQSAA